MLSDNSEKQDVIITKDLCLGYGNIPILSKITLNIHEGEFIGIFGPNGSGKSTFLRTVLGLIKPLSGQLLVFGSVPFHGNNKIGYMPQIRSHVTVANLTGRTILEASCRGTCYGLPLVSWAKKNEIQKVLELVNAKSFADRPFLQLSGGERQRILLAQALLEDPRILLLDEPLLNLDPHYQGVFVRLLYEIQKNLNVTILFTAHDPNPLLYVMNRVLFLAKGNAIIGTPEEIITSPTLSSLYGSPIEVLQIRNRLFVLGDGQSALGEVIHHE